MCVKVNKSAAFVGCSLTQPITKEEERKEECEADGIVFLLKRSPSAALQRCCFQETASKHQHLQLIPESQNHRGKISVKWGVFTHGVVEETVSLTWFDGR